MLVRWRRNDDRINILLAKRSIDIGRIVALQFLGQALGQGFVHVNHTPQADPRYRLYALDMKLPGPPKAKQRNFQVFG